MTTGIMEESFDVGQDYQKAKRVCLLICLFLAVLSIFPDQNKNDPIFKIFDLKINGPLWLILAFLLMCATYCVANFYINERRVRVNNSQLIKQNGNGDSLEALKSIEKKLNGISSRLDDVGNSASRQLELINYQPEVLSRIFDEIDYSDKFIHIFINEIFKSIGSYENSNGKINSWSDFYELKNLKENILRGSYFIEFNDLCNNRIKNAADGAARSLFDRYIRESGDDVRNLNKEMEGNYFDVIRSIGAMSHSLDTFSSKIYGGEVAFFKGECALVYLSVILSVWLGIARLTYDALH